MGYNENVERQKQKMERMNLVFDFINNVNAAAFSNTEPATLHTAARAVYGYKEMLNMEPAPFGYVPHSASEKEETPRKGLFRKRIHNARGALVN